jgi:alpha-L-fucosidase 2
MTFWTAGAGWYANFYYEYYRYTGDREFLIKQGLPFMQEVAMFYEDFLVENTEGVYEFNPSYSPKNAPANSNSQAAINATMDIGVCRQLLGNLIKVCQELGIEAGKVKKWRAMLAKLPKYMVNEDGALKEWCHPNLKDSYAHRHCSHFYPLWYGIDPQIREDPKLMAAAREAVRRRVEERRKGGAVMGFGAVQIGLAAASLGDADSVWFALDHLAARYYYPTFASAHNAGPGIFNADISGGLPAVMIEMLVQSEPGAIRLLPALPKQLDRGVIAGVACRGRITIDEMRWGPDSVRLALRSPVKQRVRLTLPGTITAVAADQRVEHARNTCQVDLEADASLRAQISYTRSAS